MITVTSRAGPRDIHNCSVGSKCNVASGLDQRWRAAVDAQESYSLIWERAKSEAEDVMVKHNKHGGRESGSDLNCPQPSLLSRFSNQGRFLSVQRGDWIRCCLMSLPVLTFYGSLNAFPTDVMPRFRKALNHLPLPLKISQVTPIVSMLP